MLPVICSAGDSCVLVLSYHPREASAASSKFSWNRITPAGGGGGAVTVILDVPAFPELAAVIVAAPDPTPLTTPLAFTVAAEASLVDHVTGCPDIGFPF